MKFLSLAVVLHIIGFVLCAKFPIVINTWPFTSATTKGKLSWICMIFRDPFFLITITVSQKTHVLTVYLSFLSAWNVIRSADRGAIDAVVEGCAVCEVEQCDGTVGYGGSPDENSDVALDALVIDG